MSLNVFTDKFNVSMRACISVTDCERFKTEWECLTKWVPMQLANEAGGAHIEIGKLARTIQTK